MLQPQTVLVKKAHYLSLSQCPSVVTTLSTTSASTQAPYLHYYLRMARVILPCSQCGTFKNSGIASCCAPGGSWYESCGKTDADHSWLDGREACVGAAKSNAIKMAANTLSHALAPRQSATSITAVANRSTTTPHNVPRHAPAMIATSALTRTSAFVTRNAPTSSPKDKSVKKTLLENTHYRDHGCEMLLSVTALILIFLVVIL